MIDNRKTVKIILRASQIIFRGGNNIARWGNNIYGGQHTQNKSGARPRPEIERKREISIILHAVRHFSPYSRAFPRAVRVSRDANIIISPRLDIISRVRFSGIYHYAERSGGFYSDFNVEFRYND